MKPTKMRNKQIYYATSKVRSVQTAASLSSELRKKLLQPRTTMWRAVKRLERHGQIEIIKKDQQNLVRLKNPEVNDE